MVDFRREDAKKQSEASSAKPDEKAKEPGEADDDDKSATDAVDPNMAPPAVLPAPKRRRTIKS